VVSPSGTGGTNIFAGTDGVGIFLSTDNGTSWNAVNAGLTDVNVACLTACPNGTGGMNIFAGHMERRLARMVQCFSLLITVQTGLPLIMV